MGTSFCLPKQLPLRDGLEEAGVAGYPNPTADAKFRDVMAVVRRMKQQPQAAKRPLLSEELREILEQLDPETAQGARDRALLLIESLVCPSEEAGALRSNTI